MLQIKKNCSLIECKYNLLFLFRKRSIESVYPLKKQKTSSITLRSPKHFNIGKHKIVNLNFKTPSLFYKSHSNIFLHSLFFSKSLLYKILTKRIKTTPALYVHSVRISVKAKFKLTWLVI